MKKTICLFLFFLLLMSGCSFNIPLQSQPNVDSYVSLASSSDIPDKTAQPNAFYQIDMATSELGYTISKNLHLWKTENRGISWENLLSIPALNDYGKPALFALDAKTVWIAFNTTSGVEIQKTADAGKTSTKAELQLKTADPNSGYGGDLAISFASSTDGFLLTSTLPAAGQMSRALYKTSDGGASWALTNDKLIPVSGYTTGIGFSEKGNGYITCTYHGQKEIPVYQTLDSGAHWTATALPVPEKYASLSYEKDYYIDAYPPVFFSPDHSNVKMELDFCQNGKHSVYMYASSDRGATWNIKGNENILLVDYCFPDENTGFGLDDSGELFNTNDGGITWYSIT